MDLVGINFSDFAITCSINSKMCDKFNISMLNFFLAKMGQFAKIYKLVPAKNSDLKVILVH